MIKAKTPLGALIASCLLLAPALPGQAGAAELSASSGVFKVVKPPQPGARRLVLTTAQSAPRPRQRHRWFWQVASPKLADANEARLGELSAVAARKLQSRDATNLVRQIAETYRAEIAAAARGAQISEALIVAVIAAESGGRVTARSPKGAQGLAQLMPGTAARLGVKDAYDPAENLRGAADYLSILLDMFEQDTLLALAGYNAGENAVTRFKGVPPYAETRDYVPKVLNYYAAASLDCLFPPRGPRSPCIAVNIPD